MDNNNNIPTPENHAEELARLKKRYSEYVKNFGEIDLKQLFPEAYDKAELLVQLDELKAILDSFRPLDILEIEKIKSAFDIEYTHASNAIEGNSLTLNETQMVVMKGITIGGKPLKDHFEAVDHQYAIKFMRELAGGENFFSENILLEIHSLVLRNTHREEAGTYRQKPIIIGGSRHNPPAPRELAGHMTEFFHFYEIHKEDMHPVEFAAQLHARLVYIHPFIDGNGRTARLMMNLILLKNGYPVTVIPSDTYERENYYKTLEIYSVFNDADDFTVFVGENVKNWLIRYIELTSSDISEKSNGRGYAFFKKIEPLLQT